MATPLSTDSAKAWVARVILRGTIVGEELINSPTAAAEDTYYSRSFPIVDPTGFWVTDNEFKVTLYDDAVAQGAGAFTLTGSLGRVVFGAAPANDSVITMDYTYQRTLAYGKAANITIDGGVEGIHVLGMRTPKELLEGIVKITGSLERYFIDRDFVGKLGLDPDGDQGQPEFTMFLYPLGPYTGKPYYTLTGVKFSPWNLDLPDPNSVVTDKLDWEALTIVTNVV